MLTLVTLMAGFDERTAEVLRPITDALAPALQQVYDHVHAQWDRDGASGVLG